MKLTILVAAAENGVIGSVEKPIPWQLEDDERQYREFSRKRPVIIGRVTRELVGHHHSDVFEVVLSRNNSYHLDIGTVAHSLETAINLVSGFDEVVVLGGAQVYRQFLPICDRILLTRVHASPKGNAFFEFSPKDWTEISRKSYPASEDNEFSYSYIELRRSNRMR